MRKPAISSSIQKTLSASSKDLWSLVPRVLCTIGNKKCLFRNLTVLLFAFTIIYAAFYSDSSHWNGLDEENDSTLFKKIFNRFYFSVATQSSVGYGDISPKTISLKCTVMIQMFSIIYAVVVGLA